MNNNESAPFRIHTNGNEPLLAMMIRIFHRERQVVKEESNGIGEINPVLANVDLALAFISVEVHRMNVCTFLVHLSSMVTDSSAGL